jgi:transcription elongation factor Elf1
MARIEVECEFACPHCGQGFVMNDSGIYTDHVEDECFERCSECGGLYQLRCISVQVEMEALPYHGAKPKNKTWL